MKRTLCFILTGYLLTIIYACHLRPENDLEVAFRACILKIEQQENGNYYVDVKTTNGKEFTFIDKAFDSYKDKISVGDSVIKIINTTCFDYIRKETLIIETCKSIKL